MRHRPLHRSAPWSRARTTILVVVVLAAAACVGAATSRPLTAHAAAGWTEGACTTNDRAGITIVVDFQRLDGNAGRRATTIVRCVAAARARRSGIEVLRAAGVDLVGAGLASGSTSGTFVCRIEGRPTADEPLDVGAPEPHREACAHTPPTTAYWSYWHAPRVGAAWTYSTLGAAARIPGPGSAEGWSFVLGRTGTSAPPPERVDAAVPAPLEAPADASVDTAVPETPAPPSTPAPAAPAPSAPAPINPSAGAPGPDTTAAPVPTPAPMTAPTDAAPSPVAIAATSWLAGELDGDGLMPGPDDADADLGLTVDVLFALRATGADDDAARVTAALEHEVEAVGAGLEGDPGLTAKLLVAAVVAGTDPTDFGSVDLRARTRDAFVPGRDRAPNTFALAFAVLGLARAGEPDAKLSSDLLARQCPSGGFRLEPTGSCAATNVDPDSTSIALQALVAAREHDPTSVRAEAVGRAGDWLAAQQARDGSMRGGTTTGSPNANSTGLAAQAFDALARTTPGIGATRAHAGRDRASSWAATLVADATIEGAVDGALAYDPATLAASRSLGVADLQRDQWRRATAQGVFALAPVSLHRLGGTPLPEPTDRSSGATRDASAAKRAASPTMRGWIAIASSPLVGALLAFGLLRRFRTHDHEGTQ